MERFVSLCSFWRRNLRLNYSQFLMPRKRKMCRQSSLVSPATFHPFAGLMELTDPYISLFTLLRHSLNSLPADSLILKLTCQHFALSIQEHWVEKEGRWWPHRGGRRKKRFIPCHSPFSDISRIATQLKAEAACMWSKICLCALLLQRTTGLDRRGPVPLRMSSSR